MSSTREVVGRYFELLNADSFDELAKLFHADASLEAPLARPRRGRANILDYFRRALANYPEHNDAPVRVLIDGNVAMVEIDYRGRTTTGTKVAFSAVDVFEIEEGTIKRLATYFDSERLARLLGSDEWIR